ncbi:phosphoribosyltransferase family protein [Mycolicibacterium fortuitum]|uniref:phosphoribosyltransferase family protein n=2 Tax=Mycolicibacterium fortuitum TaxID=1766 RepID=UPI002609DA9A|nr:phosphoribosyltransferase family protein [Mycolicibacterium fortuitum]
MTMTRLPWATQRFGLQIHHHNGTELVTDLVLPGLRRNPRRAHLLVSTVLGKHIAVAPHTVIEAGARLGRMIAHGDVGEADVLGMAETATSLGHCVADELNAAMYLHTTRRPADSRWIYAQFQEGHSHATDHALQPTTPDVFDGQRTLVLVDDEISTGKTALATIEALHCIVPRPRYIVASLVDMRSPDDQALVVEASASLGTHIEFVSLAQGRVSMPAGLIDSVCAMQAPALNSPAGPSVLSPVRELALNWPQTVPEGARHGFLRTDRSGFDTAVSESARQLADQLDATRPVLVVGHEELMYLPLRMADALTLNGFDTRFQSTTRSPAYVYDDAGYPLRVGWTFRASEADDQSPRFLYNGWLDTDGDQAVQLVLVMDAIASAGDRHIVEVLATAGFEVTVVTVAGPDLQTLAAHRRGHR